MTLEELFTLENLNNAFYESSKISHWKESTQRYQSNLLLNNVHLQDDLLNGTYQVGKTTNFTINERGKTRYIRSPSIEDRIVQKVLCKKVLIPQLKKYLIYDNYASLEKRGTSFARKRVDIMLKDFIRENGCDGYVLEVDIKKYFDNIDHNILKEMIHNKIQVSDEVMKLIDLTIDSSSDEDVGLNLGAEAPQVFAIFYPHRVDNGLKIVLRKDYGRYVDDMIVLGITKEELWGVLDYIKSELGKLKLEVNEKKTNIVKMSHGFVYLQTKYNVTDSKIIKRPTHKKLSIERKRLRKYKIQYEQGKMSELQIRNSYLSWRNSIIKEYNACDKSIRSIDKLYDELFPVKEIYIKPTREEIIRKVYKENSDYFLEHIKFV